VALLENLINLDWLNAFQGFLTWQWSDKPRRKLFKRATVE
jgi:hypothetical protein